MVELSTTHSQFLKIVGEGLQGSLLYQMPGHTAQEQSLAMQRATFGEVRTITQEEVDDLINNTRDIREWLEENGEQGNEYLDDGTFIPSRFLHDNYGYVKSASATHEQSKERKPYSKFGFELDEDEAIASFDLNSDQTYDFSLVVFEGAREVLEIIGLSLAKMTKPEHDFVMRCIGRVTSHFGISLR